MTTQTYTIDSEADLDLLEAPFYEGDTYHVRDTDETWKVDEDLAQHPHGFPDWSVGGAETPPLTWASAVKSKFGGGGGVTGPHTPATKVRDVADDAARDALTDWAPGDMAVYPDGSVMVRTDAGTWASTGTVGPHVDVAVVPFADKAAMDVAVGAEGQVAVLSNSGDVYLWDDAANAWVPVKVGGVVADHTVADTTERDALDATAVIGEIVRVTATEPDRLFVWDGATWIEIEENPTPPIYLASAGFNEAVIRSLGPPSVPNGSMIRDSTTDRWLLRRSGGWDFIDRVPRVTAVTGGPASIIVPITGDMAYEGDQWWVHADGAWQTLPTPITGAVRVAGGWDASTGAFPATATVGDQFQVTADGNVDGVEFHVGDQLTKLDTTDTATYASNWIKVEGVVPTLNVTEITSQAAMDALTPREGDIVLRQDTGHRFVFVDLATGWQRLDNPDGGTHYVADVAARDALTGLRKGDLIYVASEKGGHVVITEGDGTYPAVTTQPIEFGSPLVAVTSLPDAATVNDYETRLLVGQADAADNGWYHKDPVAAGWVYSSPHVDAGASTGGAAATDPVAPLIAADATARDALTVTAGNIVVVTDDDGAGNSEVYLVQTSGVFGTATTHPLTQNTLLQA